MNELTTLLIVDDDENIRNLIRTALTNGKRTILDASSARDGLHLANDVLPSIALIDIGLPGHFDGFSLCEALLKNPRHSRVHVVIVSGRNDPEDIERAQRLGIAAYVVKPFSPRELAQLIDRIEDSADMPVLGKQPAA